MLVGAQNSARVSVRCVRLFVRLQQQRVRRQFHDFLLVFLGSVNFGGDSLNLYFKVQLYFKVLTTYSME